MSYLKAAVISDVGLRVIETEIPRISRGEVLVKMESCGLCGTDIEKLEGRYTASMPVIGHEAAGIVEDSGDTNLGLKKGDRIFPHHHVPCYKCWNCTHGSTTMCDMYRKTNIFPGGFSEYFRVPSWNVEHGGILRVPSEVSFDQASMIEPLACVVRSVRRCGLQGDEKVLIVGAGPMGLLHAQLISATTECTVALSEQSEFRRKFLTELGFEEFNSATGVSGFDVAVVAAGHPSAVAFAFKNIRRGGKVVLFGVPYRGSVLQYELADILNNEQTLLSSNAADDRDTEQALELIASGRVHPEALITHRFPLAQVDKAVEAAKSTSAMKIVITP
ncbi:MAG: alcohol dehydrogenase catalytic domain-containing protein [Thermoprotei archaeon]